MASSDRNSKRRCIAVIALGTILSIAASTLLAGNKESVPPASPVAAPSFRHDVMALLSRAGCNAGACHGNLNGKGGLKLSLRGQDPAIDHATLTRDLAVRRIDPIDPAASLLLRKATAAIPHEGGKRFDSDSPEAALLLDWISAGAPDDPAALPQLVALDVEPAQVVRIDDDRPVSLRAVARFADGSTRDVTHLTVMETSNASVRVDPAGRVHRVETGEAVVVVRYLSQQRAARIAFVDEPANFTWADPPAANFIDRIVFDRLHELRLNPSQPVDDPTYLRRAHLDLLGSIPTAAEARAFAADTHPDKRARLIDSLLQRPAFADFWALKWADLLRIEENTLDETGVTATHRWLREAIAAAMPMDEFARRIIAARGSTYANPPANFYRALRDPTQRAEAAAQVFLGTRLQCARCHNHPFEQVTQDDYYGFAALFAPVSYKVIRNDKPDQFDPHQFVGEQVVYLSRESKVRDPRDNSVAEPRFLRANGQGPAKGRDELEALAAWMTGPDNRLFARVMVNRVWAELMGRGIVDPIDDFRPTNPPAIPDLLEALADDFIANGYDLRHLIRTIAAARVYQLASQPNDTNAHDETHFSRAIVRRLTAEQLLDSAAAALAVSTRFAGYPDDLTAIELPGVQKSFRGRGATPADQFLLTFGKPPRLLNCDCERADATALGQAFELISGPALDRMLRDDDNRLAALTSADRTTPQAIDDLYWAALSRPPTTSELEELTAYLDRAPDRRAALEDIAWGLLNAKEFVLRR